VTILFLNLLEFLPPNSVTSDGLYVLFMEDSVLVAKTVMRVSMKMKP